LPGKGTSLSSSDSLEVSGTIISLDEWLLRTGTRAVAVSKGEMCWVNTRLALYQTKW